MTDRWPPPVSDRKEGERPLLGSAGLGHCDTGPAHAAGAKWSRPSERAVGHSGR
jgi:hypothetical protein